MVNMATELEKIKDRLLMRADLDRRDRDRQAELVRERIREGATWVEVCREAGISKPTLSSILHGDRPKSKRPPRKSSG